MKKNNSKKWYTTWWAILLMIIVGLMVFAVLYSTITGIPVVSIEPEYSNSNEEFTTENSSNEQTEIEQSPVKKSIFETIKTCNDSECYNLNLETCIKTKYVNTGTVDFYTSQSIREIKGLNENNCLITVDYDYSIDFLGTRINSIGKVDCAIPLRNSKYYLYDYEVEMYCNIENVDQYFNNSYIAEPEKVCVSLEQFPITKYKCAGYGICNTEYEIKYKSDYKDKNPIISGFEIKSYLNMDYSTSVYCKKGNRTGENPNYWYCDYFELSKKILADDGTISSIQKIYAKSVFDNNLKYVKTVCEDNYIMSNWELEII